MQMADMLFSAATDHRYIQTGQVLDFTNKALEALDVAGWDDAGSVLTSLARTYATAERMEETNAWRYPLDLGKPVSPGNPLRECLTLPYVTFEYHPIWNKPMWRVGCQ